MATSIGNLPETTIARLKDFAAGEKIYVVTDRLLNEGMDREEERGLRDLVNALKEKALELANRYGPAGNYAVCLAIDEARDELDPPEDLGETGNE